MEPGDHTTLSIEADDVFATQRCANWLAGICQQGDTIFLTGELGAGKTTLARAFIQALTTVDTNVPSPSFTLVQPYDTAKGPLFHADLYRIAYAEEVFELGLSDAEAERITLIEWAERAEQLLGEPDFHIRIVHRGTDDRRRIDIAARTPARLQELADMLRREKSLLAFLADAGWMGETITRMQIAGDASTRRYERLDRAGNTAVLMDWCAGPDGPAIFDGKSYSQLAHLAEAVPTYCRVSRHLAGLGIGVPEILSADEPRGFVLLEDLGTQTLDIVSAEDASDEEDDLSPFYLEAVETLVHLHGHAAPDFLHNYDGGVMAVETSLFLDWYLPHQNIEVSAAARAQWMDIWQSIADIFTGTSPVCVLRDFHSVNLLWRPHKQGRHRVGVIDVQDALAGPAAYDLVSLLQDARIDVADALSTRFIGHYIARRFGDDAPAGENFRMQYAVLGLQRNLKIAGIFIRLAARDNKWKYLAHLPRIITYIEKNLRHEAAAPVRQWLTTHAPDWAASKQGAD